MSQLPLPIEVECSPRENRNPGLDAATVRRLKAIGIVYICTRWNANFQEWWHFIEIDRGRGKSILTKNDQGIAAMLKQGKT